VMRCRALSGVFPRGAVGAENPTLKSDAFRVPPAQAGS
jgi:hypothetical protein